MLSATRATLESMVDDNANLPSVAELLDLPVDDDKITFQGEIT